MIQTHGHLRDRFQRDFHWSGTTRIRPIPNLAMGVVSPGPKCAIGSYCCRVITARRYGPQIMQHPNLHGDLEPSVCLASTKLTVVQPFRPPHPKSSVFLYGSRMFSSQRNRRYGHFASVPRRRGRRLSSKSTRRKQGQRQNSSEQIDYRAFQSAHQLFLHHL